MTARTRVGIDYGTTNTAMALKFRVVPVALEEGRGILSSAVAFPPSGVTLVGSSARRRRAIDPRNTIVSSKRLMGRGWHTEEVAEFRERSPLELIQRDDGVPAFKTRGGYLSPVDVAATILGPIARDLPMLRSEATAVVAVPSRFTQESREATIDAVMRTGFEQVEVMDEPAATAHAYLTAEPSDMEYAAVYDLGGGTFDFALIDCRERPFRVVAYGGDLYLGGDDIDRTVASWAADEIAREHRWDLRADPVVFDRLVIASERAKIALCAGESTRIDLASVDPAAPIAGAFLVVDRPMLERLSLELVYRTFVICDAVLAEAGIKANQVQEVFLAGGTTQLPMVRQAVAQYFGRAPRADHDPMEVVALGASIAAAW